MKVSILLNITKILRNYNNSINKNETIERRNWISYNKNIYTINYVQKKGRKY